MTAACPACLRRTWLLTRLAGRLEVQRARLLDLLELDEVGLMAALGVGEDDDLRRAHAGFGPDAARAAAAGAGLELICRCDAAYPPALRDLAVPPAALHVAGGSARLAALTRGEAVAVVGTRRPSEYGQELARSLGRSLAAAGVTVVSGMARGIDTAAHAGALDGGGRTIAVLPGSAERPYPAAARRLHAQIVEAGCAVSEFGPGAEIRRWSFRARNRIIAALAALTIVVEATPRSGSLGTIELARDLGRRVGAVPGRVSSPLASGPNALLRAGATVIRDAQDVLDELYGAGERELPAERRPAPEDRGRRLLAALGREASTAAALSASGLPAEEGLAVLAELELSGWIRRGRGGRYSVIP